MKYIIGFPRTGNHFINCALEVYTGLTRQFLSPFAPNQAEGILSLITRSDKFEWVQTHGESISPPTEPFVYIFRDPVDVCYSYSSVHGFIEKGIFIEKTACSYARHMLRFRSDTATLVSYESLISNFDASFKKVLDTFGFEYDQSRIDSAKITKGQIVSARPVGLQRYFRKEILSEDYATQRILFREKWSSLIDEICGTAFAELKDKENVR